MIFIRITKNSWKTSTVLVMLHFSLKTVTNCGDAWRAKQTRKSKQHQRYQNNGKKRYSRFQFPVCFGLWWLCQDAFLSDKRLINTYTNLEAKPAGMLKRPAHDLAQTSKISLLTARECSGNVTNDFITSCNKTGFKIRRQPVSSRLRSDLALFDRQA